MWRLAGSVSIDIDAVAKGDGEVDWAASTVSRAQRRGRREARQGYNAEHKSLDLTGSASVKGQPARSGIGEPLTFIDHSHMPFSSGSGFLPFPPEGVSGGHGLGRG
jgi:hypothetical protein